MPPHARSTLLTVSPSAGKRFRCIRAQNKSMLDILYPLDILGIINIVSITKYFSIPQTVQHFSVEFCPYKYEDAERWNVTKLLTVMFANMSKRKLVVLANRTAPVISTHTTHHPCFQCLHWLWSIPILILKSCSSFLKHYIISLPHTSLISWKHTHPPVHSAQPLLPCFPPHLPVFHCILLCTYCIF